VIAKPNGGQLHLLASHEDCDGRRRLVLVRLRGDAVRGALTQDATWVLTVDKDGGGGGFELSETEKNVHATPTRYHDTMLPARHIVARSRGHPHATPACVHCHQPACACGSDECG
jgi:hypothetical protein